MAMTAAHKARRKDYLTASDLSAIFGLNPYKTAGDVWAEKTMPMDDSDDAGDAAEFGHDCEEALIRFASRKLGKGVIRNQWRVAENRIMAATLDAITDDGTHGIEAKSSGIYNPFMDMNEWGETNTADVPMRVYVQCVGQMICCPSVQEVIVPAILANRSGPQWYVIPRDAEILRGLEQRALAWWEDCIEGGNQPPEQQGPSLETIKKVLRTPEKEAQISDDLYREQFIVDRRLKEAEDARTVLRARIGLQMGDAEIGLCNLGKVTMKIQARKAYEVPAGTSKPMRFTPSKAFKEEMNPRVADAN